MKEQFTVGECFGIEEKETREEKSKENLRRALGKTIAKSLDFSGIIR